MKKKALTHGRRFPSAEAIKQRKRTAKTMLAVKRKQSAALKELKARGINLQNFGNPFLIAEAPALLKLAVECKRKGFKGTPFDLSRVSSFITSPDAAKKFIKVSRKVLGFNISLDFFYNSYLEKMRTKSFDTILKFLENFKTKKTKRYSIGLSGGHWDGVLSMVFFIPDGRIAGRIQLSFDKKRILIESVQGNPVLRKTGKEIKELTGVYWQNALVEYLLNSFKGKGIEIGFKPCKAQEGVKYSADVGSTSAMYEHIRRKYFRGKKIYSGQYRLATPGIL